MLVYPCGLDVSSRSLSFLAARLREHHRRIKSRWRRLPVGRQALPVLAHLQSETTYARLAAGFGVGTSTVYRYISEAVDLLAALAPTLDEAVRAASTKAYVLLDGTLLPIDRIAADRPFYSGKHKKHGMNVQVIADPFGQLLWASPALPGAVLPGRPRYGPVSLPRPMGDTFHRSAGREPIPGQNPCPRRTSHGYPQELAAPPQTPPLDHPHHGPGPGCPHHASRQLTCRLKRPQ
ncbi:hypothetical protein BJY54_006932 [Streptomyces nodosus]|nr:hypothetical protein [Streptomyces nodosus]